MPKMSIMLFALNSLLRYLFCTTYLKFLYFLLGTQYFLLFFHLPILLFLQVPASVTTASGKRFVDLTEAPTNKQREVNGHRRHLKINKKKVTNTKQ